MVPGGGEALPVTAVSNAGSLGSLQAYSGPPPLFRQGIRRIREFTER
jgi:hypothetical protein